MSEWAGGVEIAREIFAAALAAADPAAFTRSALTRMLEGDEPSRARRHWIIALGKAGPAMARSAVELLAERGLPLAGGLVVGVEVAEPPHRALEMLAGDHPVPAERSTHAAERLGVLCDNIADHDVVFALISGGTSALVGAPIDGISGHDLAALHALLLASGLDISQMNAVRKRFSRWGAGRLAAALVPAEVYPVLLSDVPGDDPAVIASGPCSPDSTTAAAIESIVREAGIAKRLPLSIAAYLGMVRAGDRPETPKALSPVFAHVRVPEVSGNRAALEAAASRALELGVTRVLQHARPLEGDATDVGRTLAHQLVASPAGTCLLHGGETTVLLPSSHGRGGRNQQLALAAAGVLGAPDAPRAVVLAAGTDGRDGPTDAAGAVVTNGTWRAIAAAGFDPVAALERCDAYPALRAAGALLHIGPTGTNVGDVVIGLRGP